MAPILPEIMYQKEVRENIMTILHFSDGTYYAGRRTKHTPESSNCEIFPAGETKELARERGN